jgi:Na+/H+ antiporter NhaD/arsenite permease-like protein
MIGAMLLTALNDNAAITYLASLVPGFSDSLRFAVVAGAVAGGGLTVIANAPNPAGQSILVSRFGDEGISAFKIVALGHSANRHYGSDFQAAAVADHAGKTLYSRRLSP